MLPSLPSLRDAGAAIEEVEDEIDDGMHSQHQQQQQLSPIRGRPRSALRWHAARPLGMKATLPGGRGDLQVSYGY